MASRNLVGETPSKNGVALKDVWPDHGLHTVPRARIQQEIFDAVDYERVRKYGENLESQLDYIHPRAESKRRQCVGYYPRGSSVAEVFPRD